MTAGFDLPNAQFGTAPEQEEQDEETPVNSDAQGRGFGDVSRSLGQVFGKPGGFALRPPPIQQAQFAPSASGSSGGSAPRANPVSVPYAEAQARFSEHNASQQAAFHGPGSGRQSTLGRSAQDVARQYGAAGQ
jgi:hypothetical protein